MTDYLKVIFNEQDRPRTSYPAELCRYLFQRFDLKAGDKILDLGCGRGDFAAAFKQTGLDVYGLDWCESPSPDLFAGIPVRYADVGADPFPYPNDMFDVVFSKSVIEHVADPTNFLNETRRVLKPGGRIIVMTPDWNSQMKIFYDDHTHRHPFTVTGLTKALKVFGFREVACERFYQLPVLWKYPALKLVSCILRFVVPVTTRPDNKFIRWSIELMVLGTGIK